MQKYGFSLTVFCCTFPKSESIKGMGLIVNLTNEKDQECNRRWYNFITETVNLRWRGR